MAILFGAISVNIPAPFEKLSVVIFVLCFLAIIFLAHKAAFKAHRFGIFGVYVKPGKVLGEKLSSKESRIIAICIFAIVGICIGFIYKANVAF